MKARAITLTVSIASLAALALPGAGSGLSTVELIAKPKGKRRKQGRRRGRR